MQCCFAVQQSQDGSLGLHTDGGLVNCAVLHNHQSGNGHYTELGSQLGLLVYVDLAHLVAAVPFLGDLVRDRGYHTAQDRTR